MFSFKSFIMSILTVWSLIHFKFIFVDGVRECSDFILIHVAVQFSQHCLLRRLSFLHCIVLLPLSWLIDHRCMSFSLDLLSYPIDLCNIFWFLCQYHCFDYYSLWYTLKSGSLILSAPTLLSQDCFGSSGCFVFPYTLKFFVLVLRETPFIIWYKLHRICRLLWLV